MNENNPYRPPGWVQVERRDDREYAGYPIRAIVTMILIPPGMLAVLIVVLTVISMVRAVWIS